MRYGKPVFFVKDGRKAYDPDTGTWSNTTSDETMRMANVTDMGADKQQVVFGDVSPNRKIIRMRYPYTDSYSSVRIGSDSYTVESNKCPTDKQSLTVKKNEN